jgi:DNA-directed RNA polymerase subunit K/omega
VVYHIIVNMSTNVLEKEPIDDEKNDKSDISSEGTNDDLDSIIEDDADENDLDDEDDEDDKEIEDDRASIDDADDIGMITEIENLENEQLLNELENEEEDMSLQKLEDYIVHSQLEKKHPEIHSVNYEEIAALTRVVRNENGKIIDPLHKTAPFITKYEKARIIGTRSEQLERGAMPFIELDQNIIHGRTIAMMEYEQKKIPFIIARPLPNKGIEYWRLQDLEYV